ncbi:MAG: flagellar export chaperone FliS [Clostridium sp.]|uniref:flagellar export chaperone FliS n=1 Tax=Clostridium sp. TaxID=1506 RepID=UPI003D6DA799
MAMNAYGNAFNTYKNNSVNFASKEQLLLMLVDGAVKFSKIGRQAILDKDAKKAHENIVKTQNIFYELMATLDVAKGGEWAESLMKVYDFIVRRLTDANIKKSEEIMNEIIPLIDDVRDTWNEAYKISKGGK